MGFSDHDSSSPDHNSSAAAGTRPVPHLLVGLALWALAVFLLFYFFEAAQFVLLIGLATAIVAAAMRPVADRLPGPSGIRAVMSLLILLMVVIGALALLSWALYGPVQESFKQFPQTQEQANKLLNQWAAQFGFSARFTLADLADIAGQLFTGGDAMNWAADIAGTFLRTMLALLVVFIGAMYLLAHPVGSLSDPAIRLLPDKQQPPARQIVLDLQPIYRWWLIGTLFSMFVVGTLFGLGYWIIGLRFAFALALLAALAQSVPTLGPLATLLISLLVAATQGTYHIIGVVVIYLVVQAVESYLLTPLVMRRAVHIPPLMTLLTIIFWGNVLGVAGLILAIPIDLTIWTALKRYLMKDQQT